jgi:alginate O-acetyltransferase complex protein AlgI
VILDPWFWTTVFGGALVHWVLPGRFRNAWLAGISAAYIATLSPVSLAIISTWSVAAFVAAPLAASRPEWRKPITRTMVGGLILTLAFWKYLPDAARGLDPDSFFAGLVLPVGISFYVFRLIHYVVEVGRGTIKERDPAQFLAYILLMPIFTAGPIEQFDHFVRNREPTLDLDAFVEGIGRIAQGLIKKLVVADMLIHSHLMIRPGMSELVEDLREVTTVEVWGFLALQYFYVYMDFSAYSDVAIGASRLFGIRIAENFNWPIFARNVSEFWKRWHMTLAGWTQRYVYMPVMARTRRPYYAVFATFLSMGLWHAADLSYILWGLYHAAGVSVALAFARYKRMRDWTGKAPAGLAYWGIPVTFVFICGSQVLSGTSGLGNQALFRLAAKVVGID